MISRLTSDKQEDTSEYTNWNSILSSDSHMNHQNEHALKSL
jgi:hypothetical protein